MAFNVYDLVAVEVTATREERPESIGDYGDLICNAAYLAEDPTFRRNISPP
jgi:hypothetical protein